MDVDTPPLTIFSLPNELLVAVAAAGEKHNLQWTLSHVSRRLRSVMVATPTLWTLVEVIPGWDESIELLNLYFGRSQNCLVTLVLRHPTWVNQRWEGGEELVRVAKHVAQILLHIHRVSRLSVFATRLGTEPLLGMFRDVKAPNLEQFSVTSLDNYPWSPVDHFFAETPKLRSLKIFESTLRRPLPQWAVSLTHLELRSYEGDEDPLEEFLGECSSLGYLYLDISSAVLEHRVHLPCLERLHLDFSGSEEVLDLLAVVNIFDTPALTELGINGAHGDQVFELLHTKSLPHASFPALRSFSFVSKHTWDCACEIKMPFPDAISLPFQLFPALSSLTLIDICFAANLVKGVVKPTSATWPVLKTVALSPREDAVEDVRDAVLDAMRSYVQHGLPIPTFRLCPALSSLEDWQENGMTVQAFNAADVLRDFWRF
ncbi:hypothetical protein C8R45DRAFT_170122 [Mycena sanguinolenta]|nr:hypothetical protein C8R45DRAFT_170122 [Mycena sanguinolenta]